MLGKLSPARLATLKSAIQADAVLNALPKSTVAGETIAAAFDQPAVPAVVVWKASVPRDEVLGAIPFAAMQALYTASVGNFEALKTYLLADQVLSGDASIRNAFLTLFPSGAANTQINALFRRSATRLEALYATGGDGSTGNPHRLVIEGAVPGALIEELRT